MDRKAAQRTYHYLYKITRDDGKYYIGIHSTDDLNDGYFGSGKRLWKSIKRHGKDRHKMTILEFASARSAVKELEKALVTHEMLRDPLCMNLAEGGGAGPMRHTEASRKKMSAARKGVPKSEAHRNAISAAHKGKVGHKLSDEARAKVSAALRLRVVSDETKKRMSETQKGRPRTILACPHCGKSGGNSNMRRYHFENCQRADLPSVNFFPTFGQ
jgi:hypothetical protein